MSINRDGCTTGNRRVTLDCDKGRALGCDSFCCSLIVRLRDGEQDPTDSSGKRKSCIDKDPETGRCIHQEPASGLCRIWDRRPLVCREYDCNRDRSLQIVLRRGFRSLMQLILAEHDERETKRRVPYIRRG